MGDFRTCSYFNVSMILNNPLKCFFDIKGHEALDRIPGPGYNTILLWLITGEVLVPIDSSTHYPAFWTVGLHCQTPTLTHACNSGRQFVPFLCWSFV